MRLITAILLIFTMTCVVCSQDLIFFTPVGWDGPVVLGHNQYWTYNPPITTRSSSICYSGGNNGDFNYSWAFVYIGDNTTSDVTSKVVVRSLATNDSDVHTRSYILSVSNGQEFYYDWGVSPYMGPGNYIVSFVLNYDNSLYETNYENNRIDTLITVYPAMLTIQGILSYNRFTDGRATTLVSPSPILKNTTIRLCYNDFFTNTLVYGGMTKTNEIGSFTFPASVYFMNFNNGIFIQAKSEFWNQNNIEVLCCVKHQTGDTLYSINTQRYYSEHPRSGYLGSISLPPPTDPQGQNSGAFAIGQTILKGYQWTQNNLGLTSLGNNGVVNVVWGNFNFGSYYSFQTQKVYIERSEIGTSPDEWDDNVVWHELGHHVADIMDIEDSTGRGVTHTRVDPNTSAVAWNEGFANYLSCAVNQNAVVNYDITYKDYGNSQGFSANIESGLYVNHLNEVFETFDHPDSLCEGEVACVLWDLCDNNIDDQSPPDMISDQLGDSISIQSQVFNLLHNYRFANRPIQSINDLYYGLCSTMGLNYFGTIEYKRIWSAFWENSIRFLYNSLYQVPTPRNFNASDSIGLHISIGWEPLFRRFGVPTSQLYRNNNQYFDSTHALLTTNSMRRTTVVDPSEGIFYYWVKSMTSTNRMDQYYCESIVIGPEEGSFFRNDRRAETHHGTDIIWQPDTLRNQDTVIIYPTASIIFADSGKFVVEPGGVILFAERDSTNSTNDLAEFSIEEGDTLVHTVIEVLAGGKVIGKHARFEGLPTAIKINGGQVQLDSVEFVNCGTAMEVSVLSDTVSLLNSIISGGSDGVTAYGHGELL